MVDHLFFALLLALPLIEWKWSWPRYLAALAVDPQTARPAYYRRIIVGEWIPTLILLGLWALRDRPLADMYFAGGPPLRLGLGFAYVLVLIALLWWQRRALLSRPDRRARVRRALSHAEPLLPHTGDERKLFWAICATAGVCEEIFFRGFLTWYLAVWIGPIGAVVAASALFGIGHVYMGVARVPKAAFLGLIFAVVVALTGSLFPAMLLHAAIDWNSGELGYHLLRSTEAEPLSSS
jgi:CAAX protease family protein